MTMKHHIRNLFTAAAIATAVSGGVYFTATNHQPGPQTNNVSTQETTKPPAQQAATLGVCGFAGAMAGLYAGKRRKAPEPA
ncbi:MAG: hypothetical protein ACAH83_20255 [Alphaproteobacteria bacterium]